MYEFDDLPLAPVEPATNVLVAGPAMSGTQELMLRALAPSAGDNEGTIVVSTGTGAEKLRGQFAETAGALSRRRLGIVDAVSRQQGVDAAGENVRTVSSPRDLTGIGMELTGLYESFYERGIERVRTGLDSVSTLLMYAELPTIFRFLHVFTGRVSTANGVGIYIIDPTSHDEQTTQTLSQLFDGRIDVRADDGRELRVRGLPEQPDGWQSF